MIASNGSTVMMPQAPTKEGAEFVGWALNGEIVSFPYTITGDTTFNAVWGCEHQWKQESTTSSCDQVGATFFSCEKCGKIKKEDSVKSEHSFELTESVKATCTSGGYDLYECTACGTTEKRNETPRDLSLAGHSFVPETIEPTCTKEGYTDNVCALCGRGDGNRVVFEIRHKTARKNTKNRGGIYLFLFFNILSL